MKSRIDYFLLAKNLTKRVKKTEIYPSIAPDHNANNISLFGSCESPRGPGLWKFNNLFKHRKILPSSNKQRPTVGANQNGN